MSINIDDTSISCDTSGGTFTLRRILEGNGGTNDDITP